MTLWISVTGHQHSKYRNVLNCHCHEVNSDSAIRGYALALTMANENIGFVAIIEHGSLEQKAVLLVKSIRRFLRDPETYPVIIVRPRQGPEISGSTRKKLSELGAKYVFEPSNVKWRHHPFANEAYGASIAEEILLNEVGTLVYLDSDIVCLHDPSPLALPDDKDVAVAPVDFSYVGANKYGKPINDFWKLIYSLNEPRPDAMKFCLTGVDKVKILPYFNSGVVAVKPQVKIFEKWRDSFERLRKSPFLARYSPLLNEFFFIDQALLSSSILSTVSGERSLLLEQRFNFPSVTRWIESQKNNVNPAAGNDLRIDLDDICLYHYHNDFYNMSWLQYVSATAEKYSWLTSELPLSKQHGYNRYRSRIEVIRQFMTFFASRIKHPNAE